MDPTTALIYVEALELGNFLPAFMTNTVVTSGSVDACRGAWTSAGGETENIHL